MRIAKKYAGLDEGQGFYDIKTNAVTLRLYFLTEDIVRIRALFDSPTVECSYSLTTTAWEDAADEVMKDYRKRIEPLKAQIVKDDEESVVLKAGNLSVAVHKDPFYLTVTDREGRIIHRDIPDLCYQEDANLRRIHTSEISEHDCFFGFGEKSGEFNKAQKFMGMSPKDAMGYDPKETDSLYKHIPFYIRLNKETKCAAGYFYHNTSECDFDMGREKSNYWKRHSRYRCDQGDIDLFLINGPEASKVVERYTDLTGKSALLPRQAFGYLGSSMYYAELERKCDEAIINFIDTNVEEDFPIDGFQLSSGYCTAQTPEGLKRCVFTWNKERFADPKDFFDQMNKRGIAVSPNVKPGILLAHPDYDKYAAEGIFVKDSVEDKPGIGTWWGGPGSFADFTNEKTRRYWKTLVKENVLDYGTYSVWNDNCEYDSLVDKDCRCHLEGLGDTIGHIKAAMSNLMCHITYEAVCESYDNLRPFIVCRSGHSGIQRYAQTWAGDNLTCFDTLKYNIPTILGMGLSGVANQGCDIGGFYGPAPSEELLVRWVQNGIFQPRFSIHSVNVDNSVTEPWMYRNATDLIRSAIKQRYSYIPYFYALEYRASTLGLPIMEPLFMEFQDDPNCYEEGFDFMFGPSVLVSNVVEEGQEVKSVYLPQGSNFYALTDYKKLEGGHCYEFAVDMGSIPMFLKSGGIFAKTGDDLHNLKTQHETSLTLICAPDKDGSFTLYEDDGETFDYKQGQYLKTDICMKSGLMTELDFKFEGQYQSSLKKMLLDVICPGKCPFYVMLQGKKIEHYLNRRHFDKAETGWYYSQSKHSVEIKYPYIGEDYRVQISFEPFDMIGM